MVLKKPDLNEAAKLFRISGREWATLVDLALPNRVELLMRGRELLALRCTLFIDKGSAALDEVLQIDRDFEDLRTKATKAFPLDDAGVAALLGQMSEQVLRIHNAESQAIEALQEAMS